MTLEIPAGCRDLVARAEGVIGRSQAMEFGLSADWMRQRIHHGVYATFNGEIKRGAQLWAAHLRAGPMSVLSHQTAAELYGLAKRRLTTRRSTS